MSQSPDRKPMSSESRAHMLSMLSGMEMPSVGAAPLSLAAAGRTTTVEDMFDLAAPAVDVVIAKLLPMLSADGTSGAASLPSNPIDICEVPSAAEGTATAPTDGKTSGNNNNKKETGGCPEATNKGLILATRIGRSKDLPIATRVDHPRMSSYHCEVYYHPLSLQIYLRDISTNGSFLNGSVTRMEKGKLVEVNGGEMLQFVNPIAPINATMSAIPLPSTTYLFQRVKEAKVVDDESLMEELTCGITRALLYKPVMALPCLHTFSAHALSQWIDGGNKTCPECRAPMSEVRPSHKVSNLLDQFIKSSQQKGAAVDYFTAEEMATFDKQNTIPPTGRPVVGAFKRRPNWDEEGYGDEHEEDGSTGDSDDSAAGASMPWVPRGLPFSFGAFHHANPSWGAVAMPPPTCPECNAPTPFDGFQCPPTVSHLTCSQCKTPFPDRPLCGVPQRCALCCRAFCELYFAAMSQPGVGSASASGAASATIAGAPPAATVASPPAGAVVGSTVATPPHPTGCSHGTGTLMAVAQHKMTSLPASLFKGNVIEQSILSMYIATGGCPTTHHQPAPPINYNLGVSIGSASATTTHTAIPIAQVWADCLSKFSQGLWIPDLVSVGPLTPNTAVCQPCCGKVFSSLLYHYRRAIHKDDLPPAVLARPNCWYGVHCRTQFHNTEHARAYNHVCPQEKRKE